MTFWIVAAVLLVLVLGSMAVYDRRVRGRGQRLATDIGTRVSHNPAMGNPDAHRAGTSLNPNTGRGMGTGF